MLNLLKTCSECGEMKLDSEFYPDGQRRKDGSTRKRKNCADCCKKRRRAYFYDLEKRAGINKRRRKDYDEDGGRRKKINKRHALKALYNLSVQEYEDMLLKQDSKCAICGRHASEFKKGLFIDHCHVTQEIRGLLCQNCNSGLGHFKENQNLLSNASTYLSKSKKVG